MTYKKTYERVLNLHRKGSEAMERRRELRSRATPAELAFKEILRKHQIPAAFQKAVFTERRYFIIDFVVMMKPRRLIEIDGGIHEGKNKEDAEREALILSTRRFGRNPEWKFLRFKNEQVFSGEAERNILALYRPEKLNLKD